MQTSFASVVCKGELITLKPNYVLQLLNLTLEESLSFIQLIRVKFISCSVFCYTLDLCYYYHLIVAIPLTFLNYLRIVWRFLDNDSISKNRLFLIISLFTDGPAESLLTDEFSNKFTSFCFKVQSCSISSTFLSTNAMQIPGE